MRPLIFVIIVTLTRIGEGVYVTSLLDVHAHQATGRIRTRRRCLTHIHHYQTEPEQARTIRLNYVLTTFKFPLIP